MEKENIIDFALYCKERNGLSGTNHYISDELKGAIQHLIERLRNQDLCPNGQK